MKEVHGNCSPALKKIAKCILYNYFIANVLCVIKVAAAIHSRAQFQKYATNEEITLNNITNRNTNNL